MDVDEDELERFAESGVLPYSVSDKGHSLSSVTICDSIGGGASELHGMPRGLTLRRRSADGTELSRRYVQACAKCGHGLVPGEVNAFEGGDVLCAPCATVWSAFREEAVSRAMAEFLEWPGKKKNG